MQLCPWHPPALSTLCSALHSAAQPGSTRGRRTEVTGMAEAGIKRPRWHLGRARSRQGLPGCARSPASPVKLRCRDVPAAASRRGDSGTKPLQQAGFSHPWLRWGSRKRSCPPGRAGQGQCIRKNALPAARVPKQRGCGREGKPRQGQGGGADGLGACGWEFSGKGESPSPCGLQNAPVCARGSCAQTPPCQLPGCAWVSAGTWPPARGCPCSP